MKKIIKNISKSLCILLLATTICTSFSSCHKEISTTNQPGSTFTISFSQIFNDFWNGMNKNYAFWDIDTTNWDRMHDIYAPKFKALDYDSTISYDSVYYLAATYINSMVSGLTDGSYTASAMVNPFFYTVIDPALTRKYNNPQYIENIFNNSSFALYPDSINYYTATIDSNYLSTKVVGYDATNQFYSIAGMVSNTNILYFSFSNFYLTGEYNYSTDVKATLDYVFSQMNNPKVTGLIIDMRGNGVAGGTADLNFLIGRFITSPLKIGYTRTKNGNGRLDYSPWADAIIHPWVPNANTGVVPPTTPFNKPIVVLADGKSVYCSELATMALKLLPNTKFVGDTTWGSFGSAVENQRFNTGSFNYGNYGTSLSQTSSITNYYGFVYTSSNVFKYKDGKIYEGKGFPPDYDIKVTPSDIQDYTIDPQLDKAISLLPK